MCKSNSHCQKSRPPYPQPKPPKKKDPDPTSPTAIKSYHAATPALLQCLGEGTLWCEAQTLIFVMGCGIWGGNLWSMKCLTFSYSQDRRCQESRPQEGCPQEGFQEDRQEDCPQEGWQEGCQENCPQEGRYQEGRQEVSLIILWIVPSLDFRSLWF
jgi:hypothetical protein